jgi:hypothetical protein
LFYIYYGKNYLHGMIEEGELLDDANAPCEKIIGPDDGDYASGRAFRVAASYGIRAQLERAGGEQRRETERGMCPQRWCQAVYSADDEELLPREAVV